MEFQRSTTAYVVPELTPKRKLSIVIPCYNEEKNVAELLRRVINVSIPNWEKEIIVVDDCSTDGTLKILRSFESKARIFYRDVNGGKGSAVTDGLAHATGDYIIIQDADLEYNPSEIPSLVAALNGEKSCVYGSRNIHHVKRKGFVIPRLGVWVITKLINILYWQKLTDVWTCYKLFPQSSAHYFVPGQFDSEIVFTLQALRNGYKINEVPISHTPRDIEEGKKIKYRDGFKAIAVIISDRLLHLRKSVSSTVHPPLDLLVDPDDKWLMVQDGNTLRAQNGKEYSIDRDGRAILINSAMLKSSTHEHESGINWLKSFFKQFPALYYFIWHLFCPVLMLVNGPKKIRKFTKPEAKTIDIGSGPHRWGKDFVNLDVFPFPEVDIVADAEHLPFADDSIDALVSESVLEHVPDATKMAKEMVRVLAPGGYAYISVPFIHPYHASPDDFNRFTLSGLSYLYRDLEIVEKGVRSGPWSALLMFLAYWLGVLLSFGSRKVAPFITHFLMLIIGPLKFLDFLFMWIPGSDVVATHVYIIAKKK